jgi:hypothetical protein
MVFSRQQRLPLTLAALAITLSGAAFSSPAEAQAPTPQNATFTLSGALSGVLSHGNPVCLSVNVRNTTLGYPDSTLTGSSGRDWDIIVSVPGAKKEGGTVTTFSGNPNKGTSVVLQNSMSDGEPITYWIAKSGTVTTTPTGGRVSVNLVPPKSTDIALGKPGKGNIKVIGSWGCTKLP